MTSPIHDGPATTSRDGGSNPVPAPARPPARDLMRTRDALGILARRLARLGLDARALAADGKPAGDGKPATAVTVVNPVLDRGQVTVTIDGVIAWRHPRALRAPDGIADVAHAVHHVLTRSAPRDPRDAGHPGSARHAITAACPLPCLARLLPTRTYNPLGRELRGQADGHPTVGHVLDLYHRRLLGGIRGIGVRAIVEIELVLQLAGLLPEPADVAGPADPARWTTPTSPGA